MSIWKRYFYQEIGRTFLFLLGSFYALYVMIDLMVHIKDLRAGHTSFLTWLVYYGCMFFRRLDVLIPFTVLIGSIRVLLKLQSRNELVALLASGIPLKSLLRPFLASAAVASGLLYANFEWFLPVTLPQATYIQDSNFGKRSILEQETPVREVMLKDMSKMIYRLYNPRIKQFQDVFWIASLDTIYHMKSLSIDEQVPRGYMVDLITRDSKGALQKSSSYTTLQLDKMHFDEESLKNSITPPKDQSISQLLSQSLLYRSSISDRANEVRTNFFYKLCFPLIALLAFLAVSPYVTSFSRTGASPFMTYLFAIVGLFCFFLLLQVAFTLGKSQILSPTFAILPAWVLAFTLFSIRYIKL